ncbi:WD40 repeat domain-containing protein [Kribbella sp. NPDC004536]|uniref:WD40 repeat domain-containing protein n=1 Tax=Kribbella sp. NPDC004536 TaxID=3364106 RepID=UPI00367C3A5E
MNDTENRLRDYLHSQAHNAVPADAHGPGPELGEPTRHRSWLPITAVAAAVGITVLLAVPALTNLADHSNPGVAGTPTSLTSAPPSVPYVVQAGKTGQETSTLHDGDRSVTLPRGTFAVSAARVDGGWAASVGSGTKGYRPAIISPDGAIRPIGPPTSDKPVASPDGKQIAVAAGNINYPSSVTIFDVRTGRQVDSLQLPKDQITVHAWTKDGLWISRFNRWNVVTVWQPGSGKPRTITLPAGTQLVRTSLTDTILAGSRPDRPNCAKVGTVAGDKFVLTRDYCGRTGLMSVDLAPDGRTMVDGGSKAAINLTTGAVTKLQLPDKVQASDGIVFEDSRYVLAITQQGEDKPSNNTFTIAPREVHRCDVTTGQCKVILPARPETYYELMPS